MTEVLTKEDMEAFERSIREQIIAQKDLLGFSDEKLGKAAFPFMPYPRGKVQALLVGQGAPGKRKPQNMRFPDVITLCDALGLSWVDVGREALKSVKKATKPPAGSGVGGQNE